MKKDRPPFLPLPQHHESHAAWKQEIDKNRKDKQIVRIHACLLAVQEFLDGDGEVLRHKQAITVSVHQSFAELK